MPLVSVVVALNCAASESRLICIVFAQTKAEKTAKKKEKSFHKCSQRGREGDRGNGGKQSVCAAAAPIEFDWNMPALNCARLIDELIVIAVVTAFFRAD